MHIVRFRTPDSAVARIGVLSAGTITAITGVGSLAELWRRSAAELSELLSSVTGPAFSPATVTLLPPVDGATEVWASGVTYKISQSARMEESERAASIYELVYAADRPELFFKSAAWRVVGDGEPIAIRPDSTVNVPEPEVALVVNPAGEIVGYTVCNDVSSRTIEGENPLYLPQAKMYLGACAVGPAIRPAFEVHDPYGLSIAMTIQRDGLTAWEGSASTAQLHRRFDELIDYLTRAEAFPDGVILSTGTCLVPPSPFTLQPGDIVSIEVGDVGTLTNYVVRDTAEMSWLVEARSDVRHRPASPAAASRPF